MITLLATIATATAWDIKQDSNGDPLHWVDREIHFVIHTAGQHDLSDASIEAAVATAVRQWTSAADGEIHFVYDGLVDQPDTTWDDGINIITFRDDWEHDPEQLAVTWTWSTKGGEILGFDMEINAAHAQWTTEGAAQSNDLLNSLTHEFGHVLGLDHSDESDATMFAATFEGETTKRDLSDDDVDGLMFLYGGTPTAPEPTPLACSAVGSGGPLANLGWMGALIFGLGLTRRRD
jgi:hypothetical protein